ncbi:hypothetical protein AWC35_23920 [Gibbsiella quercinecans]|uniref:Uncharacterized protein n=1 Tax=Gibbsiella quercinecans TaxID=929813 RepID=A0A250B873_9GAMM|nr:hypothetical protein AWC35_23920 [Gibbsiella quercinecans]RLM04507.1 hypothetical protein BIY30_20225 [Gibbsiella quercinecans]RLM09300.1 hypothetical protein BIY31_10025 [Gibbsiella quercinecans]
MKSRCYSRLTPHNRAPSACSYGKTGLGAIPAIQYCVGIQQVAGEGDIVGQIRCIKHVAEPL